MLKILSHFKRLCADRPQGFVAGLQIKYELGWGWMNIFSFQAEGRNPLLSKSQNPSVCYFITLMSIFHYLHEWVFPILMHSICM